MDGGEQTMQMTESEVKVNVLQAKDQRAQVKICAQLNAVGEDVIRDILRKQGVDLRRLTGSSKLTQSKTRSSRPAKNADEKQITIADVVAVIKAQIAEINRQQYELDMRKADLYRTIWDMLGEVN